MTKVKLYPSTLTFRHKLEAEYYLKKRDDGWEYKVVNDPPGYWSIIHVGVTHPPVRNEKISDRPARDHFSQTRFDSREYQKAVDRNSRISSGVFCSRCGGDGGALGNCPRCGGNGLEPHA